MAKISRLPVSIPFPSLEKHPISFVPKRKVTTLPRPSFLEDSVTLTIGHETKKQGAPAINRAKKVIKKNIFSYYKTK